MPALRTTLRFYFFFTRLTFTRSGFTRLLFTSLSLTFLTTASHAADTGVIRGTVTDPLGAVVANVKAELLENDQIVTSDKTGPDGQFRLPIAKEGRYRIRIMASSFKPSLTDVPFASASGETRVNVILSVAALAQQITVTATGVPTPQAQIGAAVSVLTPADYPNTQDVLEALPLIPGLQITQTGQRGGTTALFIRGGNDDYNKVLVDGIPDSDIGGGVEFANLALAGIDQIEVLRAPNSALYGADALAGVVNLTTSHGTTPLPQVTYRIGGGNFGTYEQEGTLGGAYKPLDYFLDFSRFDTANSIPNDAFHNATFAGNIGWHLLTNTRLRATVRRFVTADGNPNALELYGIPDAAGQKSQDLLLGATLDNQTTDRWHNLARYSGLRLGGQFTDYAPTGIPYNSPILGPLYIGAPVTLCGANEYCVSGQAAFQYPETYPNQYLNEARRDILYSQSDYKFNPHTVGLVAFKYEHESGYTLSPQFGSPESVIDRANYSTTVQINGDLRNRFYYTAGTGVEDNGLFGVAATPRVALAYYLVRPKNSGWLSGTKLRGSFSNGIKEPSIYNQNNSLYALLETLPNGPQLISQYHIGPVGAEKALTFDGGVDQQLFGGTAKLAVTYFHNRFSDVIEFVPQQDLPLLGVPAAVAAATPYGATVNSQTFYTQGAEVELETKLGNNVFARAGYAGLAAVVTRSFSSDNDPQNPTFNPEFPNVQIGAFSPLKGARPFRRAPNTGYFGIYYSRSRWLLSFTGTLVGKRDDSDFLSDKDGGNTLLLPNHNLDAGYQLLDVSGSYRVNHLLSFYSSFQNVLSQHYSEALGYPALPFTFRSGIKITLGGESWKLK